MARPCPAWSGVWSSDSAESMSDARLLAQAEREVGLRHGREAFDLSRRLPDICVSAREVASSVMHGVHGRRRAGIGEAFWQFRPFTPGESASRIDWRRSARDDRTYVREREWEAAQTIWLWIDRSPSMAFVSTLAQHSKLDRALVLGLAAADLLVRGGERVGLLELTRPIASRTVVDRLAQALASDSDHVDAELPRPRPLPSRSRAILIGDWLSDAAAVVSTLQSLASEGARGHLIAVTDPVEESFPFAGHIEFNDVDSTARLRLGEARTLRDIYLARLASHRDRLAAACRSLGWSFAVHRTDRPASEALLRLAVIVAEGGSPADRPTASGAR